MHALHRIRRRLRGRRARTATIRTHVQVPMRVGGGPELVADVFTFHGLVDGAEHLAIGLGDWRGADTPLVRLHSECMTGDVFGSSRCDCGPQLAEAVERIASLGGFVLYLRQEGRGIGLYNKLDAYRLQDAGLDTYAANEALGFEADARSYEVAAQMLRVLGRNEVELLSNNPDKRGQLEALGITVHSTVKTGVFATSSNLQYLRTKVDASGHLIEMGPLGVLA